VLGAGAAGLAVAAQLKARGVDCVVLERGPGVGTSWRGRYDRLPERAFNAMAAAMARVEMPDLRPYGIGRPAEGLMTRLRTKRYVPLQDVGIVRDVMSGRVRPVGAVQGFTATSVLLADGTSVQPDAVIAATGYGTGLRDLFEEPSLFDETGVPWVHGGAPARPGLFFMGYDVTLGGMLRQAAKESRLVARAIRSGRPRGARADRPPEPLS